MKYDSACHNYISKNILIKWVGLLIVLSVELQVNFFSSLESFFLFLLIEVPYERRRIDQAIWG